MLCIPIMAATNARARRLLAAAAREPADLYELRLDSIEEAPDVEGLIAAADRPVVATFRPVEEGGRFKGTVEERKAMLQRAINAGATYVDAEADVVGLLRRRNGVTLIASWHNFDSTPDDLAAVASTLAALPCDWVKFAVMATKPSDNLTVLQAVRSSPKPAVGIAMGELGLPSRILGPAWGSRITFGTLSDGYESAPGQPTARDLAELYRVGDISRNTAVYGLIGDPVGQSAGYRLHNRAFALAGVDAVYIPFLCRDATEFLDTMPDGLNIRGLSVTMPHKNAAFAWADIKGETAAGIGAANTLVREARGWRAENTDCLAVMNAVADRAAACGLPLSGAPALVLGNGGAARAIGAGLAALGCGVAVSGRNPEAVLALAREMNWAIVPWPERENGPWRIVANSTPVGLYPDVDATPFPAEGWREGMLAFESVYSPRRTKFLLEAERAGCLAVDGMEMFVRQAAEQFSMWVGTPLPDDVRNQWLKNDELKNNAGAAMAALAMKGSA